MDRSTHPPVVSRLHFEFEGWLGDDLVEGFPCYLVSTRLAEAITASNLGGAELSDVTVTKDEQFDELFPDAARSLPTWRWLRPSRHGHDFAVEDDGSLVVSDAALALLQGFSLAQCEVIECE